jgi:hypothetical protein
MTTRHHRCVLRHLLAALFTAASALSCGTSIRAIYESDVRFEHCMALDARSDVKPTLRRTCWDEWTRFYTFGQPRDRIDYAHLREKQLSGSSDFDEADTMAAAPSGTSAAAPDPTSAIAPPPSMVAAVDGGAPDAAAPAEVDERAAAHARCASECQQAFDTCRKGCKTPPCERACDLRSKRCAARCDLHRQGSR